MPRIMRISIDLNALGQKENERVAERICEKLANLQKIATGETDSITLRRDVRYVRVSTADYETQGGEIDGLTDDELETVKTILGVYRDGIDESEDFDSEDTYETTVFKTKIPTVQYVVYRHDGPWHGTSNEVYLRYDAPKHTEDEVGNSVQTEILRRTSIEDALQLVKEVSHSMYSNYDECDMGDFHKLKQVETMLGDIMSSDPYTSAYRR